MLPINFFCFVFVFLKKEKSPSSALADVHTHTQIQIRRETLLYLTHKGGSIQKAYRVSSKNLPLPKSGLYKFSLWDRLKQEALCNTLWCLGMMSASRFAGTWEELKVPCQIQNTKLAVPDTSLWEACEQLNGSLLLNYALPALSDRADKQNYH